MAFCDRLKQAMEVCGVRPKDLADATGLDKTNVAHFRSGQREPAFSVLARIVRALPNVDARWLICGGEAPKKEDDK